MILTGRLKSKENEQVNLSKTFLVMFANTFLEQPVEPTETVDATIVVPTTEGLEPEAWLKDDVATGKERDYLYPEVNFD